MTITSPHIELGALDTGVEIICEVHGTVLLQADIITYGNNLTFWLLVRVSLLVFQ